MNNIRKDDLRHLELFTEYGRLTLQQTIENPFQYLLFIVRDWPFVYGMIEDIFATNDDHTHEMQRLRYRLESSFKGIGAFLMPHPGFTVARDTNITGNLRQIDPDFFKHIKKLVPTLFSPENLVVKKINGQRVRARDFVQYIQSYLNVFNGNDLSEPKTLLMVRIVYF